MPKLKWLGILPKTCDLCQGSLKKEFIDGKTKMGPWAIMCSKCFQTSGVGLGLGHGQRYSIDGHKLE